jgi:Na+-driven multidrug efflux pump
VRLSWGPSGVFWAVVAADVLLTLMAATMFLRGKWKTVVV